jgi:hypothetical protein
MSPPLLGPPPPCCLGGHNRIPAGLITAWLAGWHGSRASCIGLTAPCLLGLDPVRKLANHVTGQLPNQ